VYAALSELVEVKITACQPCFTQLVFLENYGGYTSVTGIELESKYEVQGTEKEEINEGMACWAGGFSTSPTADVRERWHTKGTRATSIQTTTAKQLDVTADKELIRQLLRANQVFEIGLDAITGDLVLKRVIIEPSPVQLSDDVTNQTSTRISYRYSYDNPQQLS
jgi:hypothetical protein